MRDLVAKSTNPESVQPDAIPSPSSPPHGAEPAPHTTGPAEPTSGPPFGADPGRQANAETSTEPPTEIAEPAAAPAGCLVNYQSLASSPELVPGPTRLHLVEPPTENRGPRIDESGRRRAHIHTLFRAPSGCQFLDRRPLLRLSGKWLHEAGFPIGQSIAVRVEPGRLVIEAT